MSDALLGLDPADFGTTGLTLGMLVGIAFSEPERVLPRARIFGRGGGLEPVSSWRLNAVQELLRRHGVDLDTQLTRLATAPEPAPAPEPLPTVPPIDAQPGDVWHDTCPSFTGGQLWHARDDGNGGVELYEENGPGLVRAAAVSSMRGGMTLISRAGQPVNELPARYQEAHQ